MQNFKQYLIESNDNQFHLIINFKYLNITPELRIKIKKLLQVEVKQKIPYETPEFSLGQNSGHIKFLITKSSTAAQLMNIRDSFFELLTPFSNKLEIIDYANSQSPFIGIRNYNNPVITVEAQRVFISTNKNTSLKNVGKVIKAKELTIYDVENITSNVLGLLEMKDTIVEFESYHLEWVKILSKYIGNKGDIFECKEELINAGLKEYAKL